jgi:hypothetical protein
MDNFVHNAANKTSEFLQYVVVTSGSVTRVEIGNILENFKTDILGTLTMQLNVLQAK